MHYSIDESLSMSIHKGNTNHEQSTSDLDGRFVHAQLLIYCLLRMQSTSTDKNDFISFCQKKYHNDVYTLKMIKEFQNTYSSDYAISWYTRETFVYRLLNQSLRIQDIDCLFAFRFLIRDIEQQLQQYQCPSCVCLYRGQLMSKDELEILKQSKGKLISMNSFLSTTLDRDVAVFYLASSNENIKDNKLQPVLFEINADPCQDGVKSFAHISLFSAFPLEKEVLMMLGSVFRLNNIYLDQHHTWIINMTLCSDNDHDLKSILNHMKNQYGSEQTRLVSFGNVLVDMGYFNDAEKYYHRLLKELPSDHNDISTCYHSLGKVVSEQGNYELSLHWLHKSLEIAQRKLKKGHPRMGYIYTSIGEVYQKKGDNKQALDSYEKALEIWLKVYDDKDEPIAWCFNNIGNIYERQKKYSEALKYLDKALKIKATILPPSHPCLGNAYINLGNVYYYFGEYNKALENYELAKNIYQTSLLPHHPSIACTLKNIGTIHETKRNYSEALNYYRKACLIRKQTLSSLHPDMIEIEQDIEHVLLKLNNSNIN
ncbi:unnamed protein product [Adineta steineri]|uniref:ADP ribosyltransferase domain-containing protein n=1 Tax=Adineta steineri TaxID=433720 RepID=A0A818T410_9BILA|nr:unnamed protein product [Adineta steineri]CAF3676505.1 unnamed protein product [Adineta steineri]